MNPPPPNPLRPMLGPRPGEVGAAPRRDSPTVEDTVFPFDPGWRSPLRPRRIFMKGLYLPRLVVDAHSSNLLFDDEYCTFPIKCPALNARGREAQVPRAQVLSSPTGQQTVGCATQERRGGMQYMLGRI